MMNFPFARRTQWRQDANALNKAMEELQADKIKVIDLTASNPTNCGFSYPKEILSVLKGDENLQYKPEACGMPSSRQTVADYYNGRGFSLTAQDIVLVASTSEAYSFLMRLLVNPGEKVLIPKPSYPLFQFLLEINDVAFDYYPLEFDGHRWQIDMQVLEGLIDAQTKAIILVNPNNPTGSYINSAELNALNELCRKHKMAIISDEVFFDFNLSSDGITSCAGNKSVLTFCMGGLSKTMGLPQMKCAWILASGPQDVLQEALSRLEIIADTYLSVNTPVQNALSKWFEYAPMIQADMINRVKANRKWLDSHLASHTQLLALQGGWYATLRIPAVKSEEEWVLEFLREDHVLVYPGYFFDFATEAYIVLSLITPIADFQEGVGRLMRRLSKI